MRAAAVVGNQIELSFYYDEEIIRAVKSIPGRRYDPSRKVWTIPTQCVSDVYALLDRFGFGYDDDFLALLGGSVARQNRVEIPDIDFNTVEAGYPFKTSPYRHQKYGIGIALDHLDQFGCHALLWEMGTGKTMAALNVINLMMRRRRVQKTLVICPNSLIDNWLREVQLHTDLKAVGLFGSRIDRLSVLKRPADIYVINYEYIKAFQEPLSKAGFHLVVCDEFTRIKSPDTAVSKAVAAVGRTARFRLGMSGTPITQSPMDAFSEFRFLNEQIFGWSSVNFRQIYCVMGGYGGYSVVGFKNQKQLREKIERYSTRFLKKDCLDLPDKVFEGMPVEMTEEQQKRYDDMANLILREIEDAKGEAHRISAPIVLVQLLRLSQICGGHLRSVDGTVIEFGSAKDAILKDLLDDLLYNGNKVIVWARFIPEIEKIMALCNSAGWGPVAIYGEIPMRERDGVIQKFQTDPSCKVFIGQIGTAGYGINLTAASTAIYYSQDYSLEHYLQSQDRNHRIGVTGDKVTYINLYCKNSIDQTVQKALDRKKNMADDITGDNVYETIYGG